MFANLTEAIKRRLIQDLKGYWSNDPNFRNSLVPNIQGRYSFRERPQQAIVLKSVSANPQSLSADNFQGTVISYCNLTRVGGHPGTSIEWVREDNLAINRNEGRFPSSPGVYYIQVLREPFGQPTPVDHLVFYVDPLLEVIDERPLFLDALTYEIAAQSYHPGSLRVYEMPGNLIRYEGINYVSDPETGRIVLARPMPPGTYLSVDYRHAGISTGPFILNTYESNNQAIPGVVLAFGRAAQDGDVMAVVVGRSREACAREYGGKWEMNIEFDVISRDVSTTSDIADRTLMHLYTDTRERFSDEGIEINQVSHSGEAEEAYDETADDYFYTASLSMSLTTEWVIHSPLNWEISRILPNSLESDEAIAGLDDGQLYETGSPTSIQAHGSLNLLSIRDPWFRDRAQNFDLIR